MSEWFRRGEPVAGIGLDDRGLLYGDGLFETIAVRDGTPRLLDLHLARLADGCGRLGIEMPAANILERDIERALALCTADWRACTLKLVITAGEGPRGYRRAPGTRPESLVGVFPSASLPDYEQGVAVMTCRTRASIQPDLAGLKTLARLDQVLARREWDTAGTWEGLMFDADEQLTCGTMTNVFLVNGNTISTPLLDRSGVAGIMRRHLMTLLGAQSIECREERLRSDDLSAADEVFLCNSQVGAVPVRSIDERTLEPGEATRSVMALLGYNGVPECLP
ncbi:MAG: aminodeoxychorismate lyase [Woeseiaceae bacterium]|nr:aminodeoxychorismate lyase [Woeseiaceae bacterium]